MALNLNQKLTIEADVKGGEKVEKLNQSTEALGKQMPSVAAGVLKAQVAFAALSAVASKLGGAFKTFLDLSLTWEDHVSGNEAATRSMSNAVGGLISQMQLARAANVLTQKGFKLTEEQLNAVSKAAVEHARITKGDFVPSLKMMTQAVTGGADKALREMGINVQLTGTKAEKSAKLVELLTSKFGNLKIEATNTNEQIAIMKNGLSDILARWGSMILKAPIVAKSIQMITNVIRSWTLAAQADSLIAGKQTKFNDNDRKLVLARLTDEIASLQAKRKVLRDMYNDTSALDKQIAKLQLRMSAVLTGHANELLVKGMSSGDPRRKAQAHLSDVAGTAPSGAKLGTKPKKGGAKKIDLKGLNQGSLDLAFPQADVSESDISSKHAAAMERHNQKIANIQAEYEAQMRLVGATKEFNDWEQRRFKAQMKAAKANKAYRKTIDDAKKSVDGMAKGALANLAGAMWAAADAAIQGGASFGTAMLIMTKQLLLSVAQQATVKAIFSLAEGFLLQASTMGVPNPGSIAAFTAAGIYGAAAVAAGGAGLAMSAAGVGASGAGGTGAAAGSSPGSSSAAPEPTAPSSDNDRRDAPIVINVSSSQAGFDALVRTLKFELKRAA